MITWIVAAVVLIVLIYLISIYNRLVSLRIRSEEAWSDIDVQLKRRYDLIPNLVETVKGYAGHEKSVFEEVTNARANALGANGVADKAKAENQLEGALKSIFAVAESYPDLKANQNFSQLQTELTDTEDKIQASRRFYNSNVRELNIAIASFPSNIFANLFGFRNKDLFELTEPGSREAVKVDFSK